VEVGGSRAIRLFRSLRSTFSDRRPLREADGFGKGSMDILSGGWSISAPFWASVGASGSGFLHSRFRAPGGLTALNVVLGRIVPPGQAAYSRTVLKNKAAARDRTMDLYYGP
jgi:hypothetical protein